MKICFWVTTALFVTLTSLNLNEVVFAQENSVEGDSSKGRFSSTCPRNHPNYPKCDGGIVTFGVPTVEATVEEAGDQETPTDTN